MKTDTKPLTPLMEGYFHTSKIRQYCDYIDAHLANVAASWQELSEACKNEHFVYDDYLWFTINDLIKKHDVSKCSPEEFIQYQMKFFPVGEPDSSLFKEAWAHHQEHNPHHWQTWTKIQDPQHYEMTVHCVCMVIDWMAMGREFGGTAEEYYTKNKAEIDLPDWAVSLLERIFDRLREYRSKTGE